MMRETGQSRIDFIADLGEGRRGRGVVHGTWMDVMNYEFLILRSVSFLFSFFPFFLFWALDVCI
jgi:hypothetical protein